MPRLHAEIISFAGAVAYETKSGPKVVRFWHMKAGADLGLILKSRLGAVFSGFSSSMSSDQKKTPFSFL